MPKLQTLFRPLALLDLDRPIGQRLKPLGYIPLPVNFRFKAVKLIWLLITVKITITKYL